jgi:hypothetical protein
MRIDRRLSMIANRIHFDSIVKLFLGDLPISF